MGFLVWKPGMAREASLAVCDRWPQCSDNCAVEVE